MHGSSSQSAGIPLNVGLGIFGGPLEETPLSDSQKGLIEKKLREVTPTMTLGDVQRERAQQGAGLEGAAVGEATGGEGYSPKLPPGQKLNVNYFVLLLGEIGVTAGVTAIKSQLEALKVFYNVQKEQFQKWLEESRKAIEQAAKASGKGGMFGKVFSWIAPAVSAVTEPLFGVKVTQSDVDVFMKWAAPIAMTVIGVALIIASPFSGGLLAGLGAGLLAAGVFGIIMASPLGEKFTNALMDAFVDSGIAQGLLGTINAMGQEFGWGSIDITPEAIKETAAILAQVTVAAIAITASIAGFAVGYGFFNLAASMLRAGAAITEEAALAGTEMTNFAAPLTAAPTATTASTGGWAALTTSEKSVTVMMAINSVVQGALKITAGAFGIAAAEAEAQAAKYKGLATISQAALEMTTNTIRWTSESIASALKSITNAVAAASATLQASQRMVAKTRV